MTETTTPRRSTAVYNPHLLKKEVLIATFAARRPQLEHILDDLRRGTHQHHLIVGQRGAGKTTMLLRISYAIADDAALSKRALAVTFPEEQYNVHRLSDFWLNCVDALVDALEHRGDKAAVRRLDDEIERIDEDEPDERDRARQALALLTGWAAKADRRLVLLVDNLDLVFERLTESHWALRDALTEDNRLILVGGSSTHIHETFTYQAPFYEFFKLHELGPLSEPEARAMLLQLADATEAPRVKAALDEPGRFEALHLFSGGMPRTMVLLLRLLANEGTTRAEEDLEHLLDQVTPYYKARFEELPAQSQVIVDALALHYDPMTAAECAKKTGLEVTLVSAQLSRLARQGIVTKLSSDDTSKLLFLISERLFAVWYAMRTSRRLRRRLFGLVDAVKAFYGQAVVDRRARELVDETVDSARLLAFAAHVDEPTLRQRLESLAVHKLVATTSPTTLREFLDLDGDDRHLVSLLERAEVSHEIHRFAASRGHSGVRDQVNRFVAWFFAADPFTPAWFKREVARIMPESASRLGTPDGDLQFGLMLGMWQGLDDDTWGRLAPLYRAVERGEAPSLVDMANRGELDQLLELVDPVDRSLVLMYALACPVDRSDELCGHILEIEPVASTGMVSGIVATASMGQWHLAEHRLRAALRVQNDRSIGVLTDPELWRQLDASAMGRVAAILQESDWHWLMEPLIEALKAAGEGRRGELVYLAPELRKPTEEILASWFKDEAEGQAVAYEAPRAQAARAAEARARYGKRAGAAKGGKEKEKGAKTEKEKRVSRGRATGGRGGRGGRR